MGGQLDGAGLDLLFREARTQNGWLDTPVTDGELRAIYALLRLGPTSDMGARHGPQSPNVRRTPAQPWRASLTRETPSNNNCCPARPVFLRTPEAKARLRYDTPFLELLPKLVPRRTGGSLEFPGQSPPG